MGTGGNLLRLNNYWYNGVYAEQRFCDKHYEKLLLVITVGGSDCVLAAVLVRVENSLHDYYPVKNDFDIMEQLTPSQTLPARPSCLIRCTPVQ